MLTAVKDRWHNFRGLLANRWFLSFFYGESLKDYPLKVAIKMLSARLVFVVPLPFLLPDRRFLMNHHGARMYMALNSSPLNLDWAFGVYEYWTTRLFSDLVREDMTILDIGGHEGYYSILFARLMKDRGRVLAFEPDPNNYEWLRRNIEANGYQCIEPHEYALSDKEGDATFYPGGGVGSLVRRPCSLAAFHSRSEPTTVRTRTLDNVLREANIENVDLIKLDVEGGDLFVLRGAQHSLRTMNASIVMDVDVGTYAERKELYDLLTSCGFTLYSIGSKLKPIKTTHDLSLFLGSEAVQDLNRKHGASGRWSSLKRHFKNVLPLRILHYLFLGMPVSWIRTPQSVRQIYATKSDLYLQSASQLSQIAEVGPD